MSWESKLIYEIHEGLSPTEFEDLIHLLISAMGFENVEVTSRSGDRGIDLTATWTQSQVPGLEIDLNFQIQVKRYDPRRTLNPRFVRELKGSIKSGDYGLLVTTSRVTANTREEGLSDPSRIVSIIDGRQLARLFAKYQVAVEEEYHFNPDFLHEQESVESPSPEPISSYPRNLSEILTRALGINFSKLGRKPIYKGDSLTVLARWSQKYDRESQDYWYGLTSRDLEDIENFNITHFAYVCAFNGTLLLPVGLLLKKINNDVLSSTITGGVLRHFHINLIEDDGMYWLLKSGIRENVEQYYHIIDLST